jgi:hypothetical protein
MNDGWSDEEIDWADEQTDNPLLADDRNFYAGNNLEKARDVFASAIKYRPRIRLTLRQRTCVLFQWPEE